MLCKECGAEMVSTMYLKSEDNDNLTKFECLECDYSELVREEPENCFEPNDGAYPLCIGKGEEKCNTCCLYENMIEDTD